MDRRARALEDIAALARRHDLTLPEIAAVLSEPGPAGGPGPGRHVLVRVLGVLGATFVFAGIGVFVALQWDAMNAAARVVTTLGSGLAVLLLSALARRDPRFEKAATPLLLVAVLLEPIGMLVAFDEYGSGGDWRWASLVTSGTMALQCAAIFGAVRRSTPLFLCILFGVLFWWTALDLVDVDGEVIALIMGASILLTATGVDRTAHGDITPPWYLCGAMAFLYGYFDLVERTPFEISFLAIAAAFVYLSVVVHSRTLLIVGTLAVLAYTGWFTGEHFADSLGWPLVLILFGILMIALSAAAFRIDRAYVQVPDDPGRGRPGDAG